LAVWNQDWGNNIKDFIRYVDQNWIGERNVRTQIRKRPVYPLNMWNKHEATKLGLHRTNNLCEGFNKVFSLSVTPKATVWALVDRFKEEESKAKKDLAQAAMGQASPEASKSRNIRRELREMEFQALVSNFNSMPLKLFLDSVVNFYNN
jgi:hypothetical protein